MMREQIALTLASLILTAGCSKEDDSVKQVPSMLGAVMHADTPRLRRLAEKHIGLEERDPADQATPMVRAAQTDQWPMVEILIDHGADIWAHDQFGITAAQNAVTSNILRGSKEDDARVRVIEKLKARGYPFPPPDPDEVLALEARGEWPPHRVAR